MSQKSKHALCWLALWYVLSIGAYRFLKTHF